MVIRLMSENDSDIGLFTINMEMGLRKVNAMRWRLGIRLFAVTCFAAMAMMVFSESGFFADDSERVDVTSVNVSITPVKSGSGSHKSKSSKKKKEEEVKVAYNGEPVTCFPPAECWTMAAEAASITAAVQMTGNTAENTGEVIQAEETSNTGIEMAAVDSPKNSPEPKTAGRDMPIAIIALIALLADGYIVFFEDRNDDF